MVRFILCFGQIQNKMWYIYHMCHRCTLFLKSLHLFKVVAPIGFGQPCECHTWFDMFHIDVAHFFFPIQCLCVPKFLAFAILASVQSFHLVDHISSNFPLACWHMIGRSFPPLVLKCMSLSFTLCNLWNLSGVNSCRHFSVSEITLVYFTVHCILWSSCCHVMFACYLHLIKVMTKAIEIKDNAYGVSWTCSFRPSFKFD